MDYIIKTDDHSKVLRKEKSTIWYSTDDSKLWFKKGIKQEEVPEEVETEENADNEE